MHLPFHYSAEALVVRNPSVELLSKLLIFTHSLQSPVVSLHHLQTIAEPTRSQIEYRCCVNLNLYDSSALERLATQAAAGRHLRIVSLSSDAEALQVRLREDDYPGWLATSDLDQLEAAGVPDRVIALSEAEIRRRTPDAIAFAQAAMLQPNVYLWGGTVGPDYDCSGLVQAAFASVGIWLPRDAYQQEAFVKAIPVTEAIPGDLIFFGTPVKATHVGLYLGNNSYIHSSGKDQGRNGIGIDRLSGEGDPVSQVYRAQLRGAGRVVSVYTPT